MTHGISPSGKFRGGSPERLPSALGTGRALDALEQAAEGRSGSRSVLSMRINPGYAFVREDPRFQALLKKVGLSE